MIQILDTPPTFNPVYSDGLFFTISADTTNKFKFRYVYDVEVNGQIVFQAKATPNPNSLGVIDVSKVVKTYTTNNPIALWDTTPIYVHQTFPFSRPYEDEVIGYRVYFGYEFSSTPEGFVSGFTGSGTTEGPPSIDSGLYKTFYSTFGVNGRATQQDFNMAPFVMSGTPTGANPTTSGLFLTNSPRTRDIQESEYYTLAFTNYYLDGSTLSEPYYVEYNFYDDTGGLIETRQYQNLTTNGGGPLPDCSFVYQSYNLIYPSGNTDYNTLYVAAGPKNFSNPFPDNCAQYTIQLYGKFTGTTSPVQPTPTPTPSSTPSPECPVCKEYQVTNNNLLAQCVVGFIGCQSFGQTIVVNPGETFFICACEGSLIYECDLEVIDTGDCTPVTPTPTPTPTQTQGLTPTPTPFVCECTQGELSNPSLEIQIVVTGLDCDGNPVSFTLNPGETLILDCVCSNTLSSEFPFIFVPTTPCVTPTPTPTPTSTTGGVTPTPSCGGTPFVVNECLNTCIGGECFCESSSPTTVYMGGGGTINPGDEGYFLYSDACLTDIWFGYYEYGGSIYEASQIMFVCTVGGPC